MMYYTDTMDDGERFTRFEKVASETGELLLDTLILAKAICKDELKEGEGMAITKAVEETEGELVNNLFDHGLERFEDNLKVVHSRAKGLYILMEFFSKYGKKEHNSIYER